MAPAAGVAFDGSIWVTGVSSVGLGRTIELLLLAPWLASCPSTFVSATSRGLIRRLFCSVGIPGFDCGWSACSCSCCGGEHLDKLTQSATFRYFSSPRGRAQLIVIESHCGTRIGSINPPSNERFRSSTFRG
jgi:hypothetical protein